MSISTVSNYKKTKFERLELKFPHPLPPYNWLKTTKIYNKNFDIIPYEWLEENAELVVLQFSLRGVDRNGIIEQFYSVYEHAKWMNVPIEVINIPMDETEDDMTKSYETQANWFTLDFGDETIILLQHMYQITCVPHLYVINPNGNVICPHAIVDLELYGKNAIVSWMSSIGSHIPRRLLKELDMYGDTWHYMDDQKSELCLKGLSVLRGVSKPILSDKSKSRDLSPTSLPRSQKGMNKSGELKKVKEPNMDQGISMIMNPNPAVERAQSDQSVHTPATK